MAIKIRGKCPSASEQPSEPPYGERERLVAANDAAVFLAPASMAIGKKITNYLCGKDWLEGRRHL